MAKPIVPVEYLPILLSIKELKTELNKLGLEGWRIISSHPTVTNMAEAADDAVIFCLFMREI